MTQQATLGDRYALEAGRVLLTGVQALARLPIDQHRADTDRGLNTATLVSGYPGSPLAGYDLELRRQAKLLAEHNVVHQPAVNEELAATAVYGSQTVSAGADSRFDGVVGIWYGKAPGLDRAMDAIRHANLIGTPATGGAVVVCGDDAIAKSSTVPSAAEPVFFSLGMPVLSPGDVQEVLDFGLHAVALSRECGLWVGLKLATNVADSVGTVEVGPGRPDVPGSDATRGRRLEHDLNPRAFATSRILDLEGTLHGERIEAARRYATEHGLNRLLSATSGDRVGLVASGKTFVDLRSALTLLGIDPDAEGVRLLKLGMPYPLDQELVARFADGLDRILVIEEKRPFVEMLLRDALYGVPGAPAVTGVRGSGTARQLPELDPDAIAEALAEPLGRPAASPPRRKPERLALPLVSRTPYFCSGCPHNTSTKVPEGAAVGGGIGCHAMVSYLPRQQVGDVLGLTQMGGEGAQWIGMSPFTETKHIFQNLGDGTYAHSGSLAVRAAVAAGVDITYKLLVNSAVAMTGGQQPVGPGDVRALVAMMLAEGVRKVVVTTEDPKRYRNLTLPGDTKVVDRSRIVDVQEELARIPGVTVLIHDQECAAELRRKRKRGKAPRPNASIVINERVCEGCGDCGQKSNCLSVRPVDTEFGRKTQIHTPSCNFDYSCLDGDCPSFVKVVPGHRRAPAKPPAPVLGEEDLPQPAAVVPGDEYAMRITGVGGTGVVTTAQVVATAAMLEGRHVRALDQTGLAQKGGPVVSDVTFTGERVPVPGKIRAGGADLYLACDLLVAAEDRHLRAADAARTVAVLSTAEVPTGAMVVDPASSFPPGGDLRARIAARVRSDVGISCDAQQIAEALFGSDQVANVFLLGCAFQLGALPLRSASLEQAIRLNGAQVDANIQAFRYGRLHVADPAAIGKITAERAPGGIAVPQSCSAVAQELIDSVGAAPGGDLERSLRARVDDLIAYQDVEYARAYVRDVGRAAKAAAAVVPGDERFPAAVATGLYKLLAYKDEYEVARLAFDPRFRERIKSEFGDDARTTVMLHPPVLRALGMKRKIGFGPALLPALRILRAGRRLRGTKLDPFGYARVRRVERRLIADYRSAVGEAIEALSPAALPTAVELAELPDLVRGYEHVKTGNVAKFDARLAELREALRHGSARGRAEVSA